MTNPDFQITTRFLSRLFITVTALSFTLLPIQAHAENYYSNNSINAGFYLRIPFGPIKKKEDRLKYGLRLGMSRDYYNFSGRKTGSLTEYRQTLNADIMSLNFSESGLQDLSFAGQPAFLYRNGIFHAADTGSGNGGISTGKTIFIIGAAVGLGFIAIALTENPDK